MKLSLISKMACRNLWRNKRRTLITSGSVMFALVLALFTDSMTKGSHEQMIGNTLKFGTGYLQIQDTAYFESPSLDLGFELPEELMSQFSTSFGNEAYLIPRIESFILAAGEINTRSAFVIGIIPELENRMNGFLKFLQKGRLFEKGKQELLIGQGLAQRLSLNVGDTLVLVGQGFQGIQAAGKYTISGLVDHPMEGMNNQIIYMDLDEAAWLFSMDNRVSHYLIMSQDDVKSLEIQRTLMQSLEKEGLTILHWKELQPDLVKALVFDLASGRVMQLILYLVISFGIFGTVLTMTLERQKEFAILVSLGMKRHLLAMQCFLETIMISLIGVIFGLILGLPVLIYFFHNPIPLTGDLSDLVKEYGMEPYLPFSLSHEVFVFQGLVMLIISLIITTYPVWRSMTFPILENLRR
ncbi:ABC transporter permease [Fontibacter flavus]|uniref:ABC transporter permease n=1 Tax=Fontibacter flavus TaxID=654838 RepID=A0ABV6FMJ8_9BACT